MDPFKVKLITVERDSMVLSLFYRVGGRRTPFCGLPVQRMVSVGRSSVGGSAPFLAVEVRTQVGVGRGEDSGTSSLASAICRMLATYDSTSESDSAPVATGVGEPIRGVSAVSGGRAVAMAQCVAAVESTEIAAVPSEVGPTEMGIDQPAEADAVDADPTNGDEAGSIEEDGKILYEDLYWLVGGFGSVFLVHSAPVF